MPRSVPWGIYDHVRTALDCCDEAAPEKLARMVADGIPEQRLRGVLTDVLVAYVRQSIDHRRAANPVVGWLSSRLPRADVKAVAFREAVLLDRLHVGDGTWKRLGECTAADLEQAALERRRQARLLVHLARRLDRLAKFVRGRGMDTVAQLPVTDLLTLGTYQD